MDGWKFHGRPHGSCKRVAHLPDKYYSHYSQKGAEILENGGQIDGSRHFRGFGWPCKVIPLDFTVNKQILGGDGFGARLRM